MATAAVSPALDGAQTTKKVPHQPLIQRASLKKDSRYTRAHNNASVDAYNNNPTITRRADRHSLRPAPVNGLGTLDPAARTAAKTPMKAKRAPQETAGSGYGRSNTGRSFTVGNIGNGGRIYLRYYISPDLARISSKPGALGSVVVVPANQNSRCATMDSSSV